jgi:hypothetical protein
MFCKVHQSAGFTGAMFSAALYIQSGLPAEIKMERDGGSLAGKERPCRSVVATMQTARTSSDSDEKRYRWQAEILVPGNPCAKKIEECHAV